MLQSDLGSIAEIDKEITRELGEEVAPSGGNTAQTVIGAARKPFRIRDFDPPPVKEMAVFTHAKKLGEYIFIITEKSPKKLRWSIVTRMQNKAVEVVENLYRANYEKDEEKRKGYQKDAAVCLNILDFYAETARKKQAITIKQTEVIAKELVEIKKLLVGWMKTTSRQKS